MISLMNSLELPKKNYSIFVKHSIIFRFLWDAGKFSFAEINGELILSLNKFHVCCFVVLHLLGFFEFYINVRWEGKECGGEKLRFSK